MSTVTALWNIPSGLRDRAHPRLDLRFRKVVQDTTGQSFVVDATDLQGAKWVLTITNTGRRPITVLRWMGEYSEAQPAGRYFAVVSRGLPKELKETEQHVEFTDDFARVLELGIKRLFVVDSGERQWPVPGKELRAAKADWVRLKAAPPNKELKQTKPS